VAFSSAALKLGPQWPSVAPRSVRGRPSRLKGAFGVASRSLRDP
jgi:hypothetical protein